MVLTEILDLFVEADIKYVIAMPDSYFSPLCKYLKEKSLINYIQVTHEADAVSISAGLRLTGKRSVVLMENSGLRTACETLARFHLSQGLYTFFMISYRGDFGERNWWGQSHQNTMIPLLKLLKFRWEYLETVKDLRHLLNAALATLDAQQSSVALIIKPKFFREIQ